MPQPRLRRSPLDGITGYAGGTLGDQLSRDPKEEIYKQMQQSILPPPNNPTDAPVNIPSRVSIGSVDKTLNGADDLVRLRENEPSPADPNATRPRYAGVGLPEDALGKSAAILEAKKQAPPNSEIQVTENRAGWGAPKKTEGFWGRLKQAGKGAVISMGEYAKNNPGASSVELLSAGATGGGIGAASPVTIDALMRQAEIKRDEQQLGRDIGLAQETAQLEGLQAKPILEAERIRMENEERAREAQRKTEEFAERQRHNRATENRPRDPRPPLLRTRKNSNGTETTLKSSDNGETWVEIKDLTSAPSESGKSAAFAGEVESLKQQRAKNADDAQRYTKEAEVYDSWRSDPTKTEEQKEQAIVEAKRRREEVDRLNASNRQLDKDIAQSERQMKVSSPRGKSQVVKPARDGKYHYTPEQIRASLQPGQSYEEIYAKLKANPKVAIDEQ